MLQQAVGHKGRWDEVGRGSKGFQLGGGFAADCRHFEALGPMGQAAAQPLQPLLHGLHPIAAREHQPVEVLQLRQGVIEGPPFIGRPHHQGGQIHHLGPSGFKQPPCGAQLGFGPGHRNAATGQGEGHGLGLQFHKGAGLLVQGLGLLVSALLAKQGNGLPEALSGALDIPREQQGHRQVLLGFRIIRI